MCCLVFRQLLYILCCILLCYITSNHVISWHSMPCDYILESPHSLISNISLWVSSFMFAVNNKCYKLMLKFKYKFKNFIRRRYKEKNENKKCWVRNPKKVYMTLYTLTHRSIFDLFCTGNITMVNKSAWDKRCLNTPVLGKQIPH